MERQRVLALEETSNGIVVDQDPHWFQMTVEFCNEARDLDVEENRHVAVVLELVEERLMLHRGMDLSIVKFFREK